MFQTLRAHPHELEIVVLAFGLLFGIIIFLSHRRLGNVSGIYLIYAAYSCLVLSWFFTVIEDLAIFQSRYEIFNLLEHFSATLSGVVLLAWTFRSVLQEEESPL